MIITDEMVEAACVAFWRNGHKTTSIAGVMRAALEAALSAAPDAPSHWRIKQSYYDDFAVQTEPKVTGEVVCGCGDVYPEMSYGAAWIHALGHCENCDAAKRPLPPVGYIHDGPPLYGEASIVSEPDGWYDFPLYSHPQSSEGSLQWAAVKALRALEGAAYVFVSQGEDHVFDNEFARIQSAIDALRGILDKS